METLQEIYDFIDTELPSNDEGLITASVARNVLKQIFEVMWLKNELSDIIPGYKSFLAADFDADNSLIFDHNLSTTEYFEKVSINGISVSPAFYLLEPVGGNSSKLTFYQALEDTDKVSITYLKVNNIVGSQITEFIELFNIFYDSGVNRLPRGWDYPTHTYTGVVYSANHYMSEYNGKIRFIHKLGNTESKFYISITQPFVAGTYQWTLDYYADSLYQVYIGVLTSNDGRWIKISTASGQLSFVIDINDEDTYPGWIVLRVSWIDDPVEDIDLLIDNLIVTKIG